MKDERAMVDDTLLKLLADASPRPWTHDEHGGIGCGDVQHALVGAADAALIVAAVNSFDLLLAVANERNAAFQLIIDEGQLKREEIDMGLAYCIREILDRWQGSSDEADALHEENRRLRSLIPWVEEKK